MMAGSSESPIAGNASTGADGRGGAVKTAVERIATYLAGGRPTKKDIQQAADILVLIQEPDAAMAEAGDASTWRHMIDAALVARWDAEGALVGDADTGPGADEKRYK